MVPDQGAIGASSAAAEHSSGGADDGTYARAYGYRYFGPMQECARELEDCMLVAYTRGVVCVPTFGLLPNARLSSSAESGHPRMCLEAG